MAQDKDSALDDAIDRIYSIVMEPEQLEDMPRVLRPALGQDGRDIEPDGRMDVHLKRAADLLGQFSSAAPGTGSPGGASQSQPTFQLDEDLNIITCNQAASQVYGLKPGDGLVALPLYRESQRALESVLRKTRKAALAGAQETAIVRLIRSDNDQAIIVSIDPIVCDSGAGLVEMRTADIICSPGLLSTLESTFKLTPTETEVAQSLIEGASIEEIATSRNNTVGTIRVHVRALFAKTETHSQAEFVRMAIGLALLVHSRGPHATTGDIDAAAAPYPRVEHRHTLSLPRGGTLAYTAFGPESGFPLVFMHDNILGDAWPAETAEEAIRRNFRIIAPARPYFSGTPPCDPGANPIQQFTEDTLHLLNTLGIARYVIVSRTTGSAFAGMLALADRDRCRGVLALSPALPTRKVRDYDTLNDHARFVALGARFQSAALLFACRAGEALYRKVGARRYLKTVLARSRPDQAICDDPANASVLQHGLDFQENYKAFYNELLNLQSQKLPNFLDLPCPVHLMVGDMDTNNRKQQAERLLSRGANFEVTALDGAGALFFYTHGRQVLDAVETLCATKD